MSHRKPLPEPLASGPFRSRDAAPTHVPISRLRSRDLNHDVRGTRVAAASIDLGMRCALFQLRMPRSSAFSHDTAAQLQGIPLPWHRVARTGVDIAVPSPARAPHADGVRGHKLRLKPSDILIRPDGLRVTTPVRTWLDLGTSLSLLDLVAAGDFIVHWRRPLASIDQLRRGLRDRCSRRGLVALQQAIGLLSDRSEAPPESMLRVIVILAGLPEPSINTVVTDRFGEFVARTDLEIEEYLLVLEYMGDYHRTSVRQWRSDMTRRSRIEATGRRVMELNADDLRDPVELIDRIRRFAALGARGAAAQ